MADKRPEALSPCYGSIISTDIPEGFQLSWKFVPNSSSDVQTKAFITIYENGSSILTKTVTGATNWLDLSTASITWKENVDYEWNVVTYGNSGSGSETSVKARFRFANLEKPDPVIWSSGPEAYEYMGERKYFDTIRDNVLRLFRDYKVDTIEEATLYGRVSTELFKGDVVPSRTDFVLLENAINLITRKEFTFPEDIQEMIEDSLGAGDVHRIYEAINRLLAYPPKPMEDMEFSFSNGSMGSISSITARVDGKEDNTVDLSWNASGFSGASTTLSFKGKSPSEDALYYACDLEYGTLTSPFIQRLYFREADLDRLGRKITIPLEYSRWVTSNSIGNVQEAVYVQTVDIRGNYSEKTFAKHHHGSNFKTPIGLSHYEVQYEKGTLSQQWSGYWYTIYQSSGTSTVHTLESGKEGSFRYAVQAVDKSGLRSDWVYSNAVVYDPLKPPEPPRNLRTGHIDTSQIQFLWDAGARTEGFTISFPTENYWGRDVSTGEWWYGPKPEGSWHEIRVQAYNRAGRSSWVGIWAQVKTRPPVWSPEKAMWCECWRTAYTINGGRSWNKADWRVESWDNARFECIQGMWIELRTGYNTDGRWVQKGTTYGNHKSLIFADRNYWKNLLAGKEILEIQIYMKRKSTSNGYPNDGRWLHFWTHNYDSVPWGQEPWLGNPRTVYENFARGEGKWINLPIEYAHMLQRGEIGGFALHSDFRYADNPDKYTYLRFDENMRLRVKYK